MEELMVAGSALSLHTDFRLTDVQVLSCILAVFRSTEEGHLLQVTTGSEKSSIIAIIAVLEALSKKAVDIYTSNSVLAERDARH